MSSHFLSAALLSLMCPAAMSAVSETRPPQTVHEMVNALLRGDNVYRRHGAPTDIYGSPARVEAAGYRNVVRVTLVR